MTKNLKPYEYLWDGSDPGWVLLCDDDVTSNSYTIFNRRTSVALIIEDNEDHAAVVERMIEAKVDILHDIPEGTRWTPPEDN